MKTPLKVRRPPRNLLNNCPIPLVGNRINGWVNNTKRTKSENVAVTECDAKYAQSLCLKQLAKPM